MPDDKLMDQNEIERLLAQAKPGAPQGGKANPVGSPGTCSATDQTLDQSEIESLLNQAGSPAAKPNKPALKPDTDSDKMLGQNDIETLLSQAGKSPPAPDRKQAPNRAGSSVTADGAVPPEDVDYLLNQAEQALKSIDSGGEHDLPQGVIAFRLEEFRGAPASTEAATLDLIRDVELDLKIELGRTHMYLEDVLRLRKGSVVPLDKLAGDPVDVYVNERLVARGEVLVLNDNFCVRIAELIAGVGAAS